MLDDHVRVNDANRRKRIRNWRSFPMLAFRTFKAFKAVGQ